MVRKGIRITALAAAIVSLLLMVGVVAAGTSRYETKIETTGIRKEDLPKGT